MVEKVEDKEFKRIQATGKYVVLKCVKIVEKESVIKTAGGIIIPGQESKNTGREVNTGQEKVKVNMYIDSVGPLVKLEDYGFKVGDCVIANNYDLQFVGKSDEVFYALTQAESIKCIIEE